MRELLSPSDEIARSLVELRAFGEQYVRIGNALIGVCVGLPREVVIRRENNLVPENTSHALRFILQGAGASTNTLLDLSDGPGLHTRDCYGIARSIVEALVNACFIMAGGETKAEQAIAHARQKAFADLSLKSEIGDSSIKVTYSGKMESEVEAELQSISERFRTRKGREKNWTDENIDERIAAVGTTWGSDILRSLHFARFAIYRHSSELLHGSLFSAHFFNGVSSPSGPPKTKQELADFIGDQHLLLLLGVLSAWDATIQAFHKSFGYQTASTHSKRIWQEIDKIPIMKNHTEEFKK